MKLPCLFAIVALILSSVSAASHAESNQEALDAAQLQRRMQEEQSALEKKQASQARPGSARQLEEQQQLDVDQRRAQRQLQLRQIQLKEATGNAPRTTSPPLATPQAPLQNQLFERERQQQDLSFDIQRQQLQFRQRFNH